MKKNTNSLSDRELTSQQKKAPNPFPPHHTNPDHTIGKDKDPVIKKEKNADKQYKQQSEFIDRDSNSKEQG